MATRGERERREVRKTNAADWAKKSMGSFESTSVKAPEGVSFFALKNAGTYEIDVVPFVTGKGNPAADEGMEHFERTYYAHRNMGLEGKSTYCCARTFGEACPVCAWIAKHGGSDPDNAQRIKQQVRQLWCVIDLKAPDKGVQIFDAAFFKSFGEMMKNKLKARPKYGTFADLEGGHTLILTVEETTIGKGGKFNAVTNIEMEPRDTIYTEEDRDNNPCLDDLLIRKTREELEKILNETLYGDVDGPDGGKEEPARAREEPEVPRSSRRQAEDDPPAPPLTNGRTTRSSRTTPDKDETPEPELKRERQATRPDARGNEAPAFEVGQFVVWDKVQWTVQRINRDGSLDLEDDNGEIEREVVADEVKPIRTRGRVSPDAVPAPTTKPQAKDEEDDAPAPRRGASRRG